MYKNFFGLRENPFNANPDPRYLFLTPQTQEALDEMTYGIHARKGLIVLTGEVGTGKTTLLNRLLDWLHQQKTPTAFIFNSHLESCHLFDFILSDFGVPFDSIAKSNALMRLNNWLIERYRAGETAVLIVDEAQGLPVHLLEEIRMLLNLETPYAKLLQIVLAGQPELEERLERPDMRQLKQRITLRCKTAALTPKEARDYVHERLRIAGANGKPIFAPQALDALHFYSRGIPRVMNLLCEHALINAYADNVRPIPAAMIGEIAREFQFEGNRQYSSFEDFESLLDATPDAMEAAAKSATGEPVDMGGEFSVNQAQFDVAMQRAFDPLNNGNALAGEVPSASLPVLSVERNAALNALEEAFATAYAVAAEPPQRTPAGSDSHESPNVIAASSEVGEDNIPQLTVQLRPVAPPRTQLRIVDGREGPKPKTFPSSKKPAFVTQALPSIAANSAKSTFLGARRSTRSTPGLWLAHRIVKLKNRLVLAAKSPDWTQINGTLQVRVNRVVRSARVIRRDCTSWLRKSYTPTASRVQAGARKSVFRWLNEPWPPASGRNLQNGPPSASVT
jgi:general secretion pathway protein A